MLKSSLKTGMIVVTRDGGEYMVMLNVVYYGIRHHVTDVCVSKTGTGWLRLSIYNEDLTIINKNYTNANELDIVAVYAPTQPSSLWSKHITDKHYWECVWKREESPVEMTVAEIEAKLGIKNLKIIKEHGDE